MNLRPVSLAVLTLAFLSGCGSSDGKKKPRPGDAGDGQDAGNQPDTGRPPAEAAPQPGPEAAPDTNAPPPSIFVLGQPDGVTNDGVRLGMALPADVVIVGQRLLVADQNNSRVLIWNTIPTRNRQQADLVLGQPDLSATPPNYDGVSPRGFYASTGVASDGTRVAAGDRFNHRVLIWNTFPTRNFQPADVVLGQPDFTTNGANTGGLSARSLTEPSVWLGGGKLFAADRSNFRVLIWNTIPTVNNAPADVVLGQPDMVSAVINNGGLGPSGIADPGKGWVDGTRLYVPDLGNNRVLIWNTIPTTNNAPADRVLGQPNMVMNSQNAGGPVAATGFVQPIAVHAAGNTVAVADYSNNRVLVWTSPITADGQAADFVLGQPDFASGTENTGGLSASTLYNPTGVFGDATRLAVTDRFNNRVLFFSPIPTTNGAPASLVLGQPDLVSGGFNNGGRISASTYIQPVSVTGVGARFAIADSDVGRVLVWDAPPTSSNDLPTLVLGQPDFTSSGFTNLATNAQNLCSPWHVHSDGTRLAVGEQCGRRVVLWNPLPTANHAAADVVVGQPDMTSSTMNNGGLSATSLGGRPTPHLDGQRLFVADPNNHRVLVWNAVPTVNGSPADLVLGQPDPNSSVANNGGVSARSLAQPILVATGDGRLLVADSQNHRVLVWNATPTASRAPADVVLGQPDMTFGAESTPSARTLRSPRSLHVDAQGRLYVVDAGNHRVLYWNTIPTANGVLADGVLGQPGFDTGLANNGGLTAETLQGPSGVVAIGDRVYVADTGNSRVVVYPKP